MNTRVLLFGAIFAAVAATQSACESWWTSDEDCTPAPFDCLDERPSEGHLVVLSSIGTGGAGVPIWVFRGDFEHDELLLTDTLNGTSASYVLPADQYYSVVALYVRANGDTVVAIDGDDIDVDYDDYCGGVRCYTVDDGEVDVRLN